MDKLQGWTGLIIILMVYLTDPGFGYAIVEGPQNLTVVVGSVAQFSCTASDGWKILIWLFNGNPKLSVLSNGQTTETDKQYTQKGFNTSGNRFTSELTIHNVQLTNSGQIKCSLQSNDNRYAFLSVQIRCDNEDWRIRTIILAVVLAVALLLLVILIVLLIICCCKRRKESNYQSELRKISGKKEKGRNLETVNDSGKENYGYSAEPMPRPGSTSYAERNTEASFNFAFASPSIYKKETVGDHTSFSDTKNVYDTRQDLNVSSSSKVLNNEFQTGELPSRTNVYPINPVKIRNVTLI